MVVAWHERTSNEKFDIFEPMFLISVPNIALLRNRISHFAN